MPSFYVSKSTDVPSQIPATPGHQDHLSQWGMSLTSLVVTIAVLGFSGLMLAKCVPAYIEYVAVQRIVKGLEQSLEPDVRSIKESFSKRASIEYVTSVTPQDLTISRTGTGWSIKFDYEKRIPIAGNASLVFDFSN